MTGQRRVTHKVIRQGQKTMQLASNRGGAWAASVLVLGAVQLLATLDYSSFMDYFLNYSLFKLAG